jgi:hypothetical protein
LPTVVLLKGLSYLKIIQVFVIIAKTKKPVKIGKGKSL